VTTERISVICIARTQEELLEKRERLRTQTLQDFEFVGEAGGTIPQAWNRAIARAQGQILVFTETDARPVDEHWLEQLVAAIPDEHTMVKGLEINSLPWAMDNLACHRSVLANVRFNEEFLWAEDTELFCRLRREGYELRQVAVAPVIHLGRLASRRFLRRAFRYGIYNARLRLRYREPVLVSGIEAAWGRMLAGALNLLGLGVGYLVYWPERFTRRDKGSERER
jgi:GT2 family glycosyltransferase